MKNNVDKKRKDLVFEVGFKDLKYFLSWDNFVKIF